MEPGDYLRGLKRGWKVIAACVVVALSVGWFVTRGSDESQTTSTRYRATTHLIHSSTLSNLSAALRGATNLSTIAALVTLGDIPAQVADEIDFEGRPEELAAAVEVEVDPASGLLTISAIDESRPRAVLLADSFASALMSFLEDRNLESRRALQEELEAIEQDIRALDRRLETAAPEEQRALNSTRDGLIFDQQGLNQQIADLDAQLNPSGLEVVEPASATPVSSEPGIQAPRSRAILLLLVGVVGLIIGIGLALLLKRYDTRIETKEEAEEAFKLPVIGEIPLIPRRPRGSVVSDAFPHAPASNAFRLVAAALQFGRRDRPDMDTSNGGRSWRTVLVTSGTPSEGKSTTVANLAATFAEVGKRVIVLCCDFRHPTLHVTFDVKQGPGLAEVLATEGPVELDGFLQSTELDRVRILSTGRVPDHTTGLFGSDRMRDVLTEAQAICDIVLLDTAPVLVASEWAQVLPGVDAVLVVARAGKTDARSAERTAEVLSTLQAPVVGVVLNGLPRSQIRAGRYGSGSGYGYGSGYGSDQEGVSEPDGERADDEPASTGANGESEGQDAAGRSPDDPGEGIPQLARPSKKD